MKLYYIGFEYPSLMKAEDEMFVIFLKVYNIYPKTKHKLFLRATNLFKKCSNG